MPEATTPASRMIAVTLNNDTVYSGVRGFHVNGSGTLVVEPTEPWTPGGSLATVSLTVLGGQWYPYRVRRFLASGSSDTAVLGIRAFR